MKALVIANINARNGEVIAHNQAILEHVSQWVKGKPDVRLIYATSVQQIADELEAAEAFVLVTNFPPDSTYLTSHVPEIRPGFGGLVYSSPADSYARTKGALGQILPRYPNLRTLVVTGAPRNALPDQDILSLADVGALRVVRKTDFFNASGGYQEAYASVVLRFIATAFDDSTGRSNEWRTAQFRWLQEQLGQIRVLIISQDERLASHMGRLLNMEFTHIAGPFTITIATTIGKAHECLLGRQFEAVVCDLDSEYWGPICEALWTQMPFVGLVCLQQKGVGTEWIPRNAIVVPREPAAKLYIRSVALAIMAFVNSVRSKVAGPSGIQVLQREIISQLSSGDRNALGRALRILTAHHNTTLQAISGKKGDLTLFIPVQSARDLDSTLRKALFISDRTVFTQLPASKMSLLAGSEVQIMPLWDIDGMGYASVVQSEMADVIRAHASVFADGMAIFYPSPTLISITRENVDEIAPSYAGLLGTRPDLPIWQENDAYEHYLSADKIGADHAVLDDYRPMAEIGRVIASLEIPFIANVSPQLLYELLLNNSESLTSFQKRTRRVIDDLVESGSDIQSVQIRKRFNRDIEDGVKEYEGKVRLLKKSTAVQQAGGALVTAVATLTAISLLDLPAVAAKLLGSGGIGTMAFQFLNYLMQQSTNKKSAYHIVWQLKRGLGQPKR